MNDLVDRFRSEGFLVSPKVIPNFKEDFDSFIHFIKNNQPDIGVIDEAVLNAFHVFNSGGFASNVKIIHNYETVNEGKDISHWLKYYTRRYDVFSNLLSKRAEMKPVMSIGRLDKLIGRDEFGVIGLVSGLRETGNGNFMIDLEDPTGSISLLVSKGSPCFGLIGELVLDEVIGVNVRKNGRWCFVEGIIFPEIPVRDVKKCSDDSCAVFISDSHVGSNNFLPEMFQNFFDWLNQKRGSPEERVLAGKVKYLFFSGDLVDGVGVYPDQDQELNIKDIFKQYETVSEFLKQVPSNIKVIISPGNHDALSIALPQPPLSNEYARSLLLPNVQLVSNPATVNIHSGKGFSGYDVLVYHGNSYDHFIDSVPRLRKEGYYKPELVMEFLLRKRHLSPSHGAAMVVPSADDFLLINQIPDIFVSGHLHQSGVGNYKGVSLLNSSCFQGQSAFMKRLGINPNPGKIPVMSLNDRRVRILDFQK